MKYNTFFFRDLDNNIVLVRPEPDTNEPGFHIVDGGFIKAHELPLNCVDAVEVTELQEDDYSLKPLFRLAVVNSKDEQIDLATLAEEDKTSFLQIITRLRDLINHKCSMETQEA